MKRRSFLAMLGIAPVAAAVPAVAATKEIAPFVIGERGPEIHIPNIGVIRNKANTFRVDTGAGTITWRD